MYLLTYNYLYIPLTCLKPEVPLDVDYHRRRCPAREFPEHLDVLGHHLELLARVCGSKIRFGSNACNEQNSTHPYTR